MGQRFGSAIGDGDRGERRPEQSVAGQGGSRAARVLPRRSDGVRVGDSAQARDDQAPPALAQLPRAAVGQSGGQRIWR